MDRDIREIDGACHCKAVRFHVHLPYGLNSARRCTCSYCRMRGAVAVTANADGFHIASGAEHLARYRFNTKTAEHFFCAHCGIYTHHRRRSNPKEFGVNVACLEGLSPFDFDSVPVVDGVNHPSDVDVAPKSDIVGVLNFVRNG